MLILSGICVLGVVALLVIGEDILPLYGGDLEMAERGTKASFTLLAGWAFAFAQPAIWTAFSRNVQKKFVRGVSKSALADALFSPALVSNVRLAATVFCWMTVVASAFVAYELWHGRG